MRIDQFPDHLIELVNRSRAGRSERREDLHTVYAVLLYLRQIDIPYMLSGFLLPGTLADGKIVAVEKAAYRSFCNISGDVRTAIDITNISKINSLSV